MIIIIIVIIIIIIIIVIVINERFIILSYDNIVVLYSLLTVRVIGTKFETNRHIQCYCLHYLTLTSMT